MNARLLISALLLSALISACTAERNIESGDRISWQLPSQPLDMQAWPAPDNLAQRFVFQGEIDNPDSQTRLLRYSASDNPERKLDITLYPIPAGWEDLPPSRLLGGHYGQVRQHLVERLMLAGASEINVDEEQLEFDSELEQPVVSSRFEQIFDSQIRITRIAMTTHGPVFVRASLVLPDDEAEQAHDALIGALRDYLAAMRAQD